MTRKKIKNKKEPVFSSNEVMMMLEQMSDGIAVIAEQGNDTAKKIDRLETRFDGLETRFDGLEARFDGLETKVDNLQSDVTEIKHKLAEKVDRDEFQNLEKRMIKLEKLVFSKIS